MTPNQVKGLMIKRNAKATDTQPERATKEILNDWVGELNYLFNQHVWVIDPIEHKDYRFQLDFCLPYGSLSTVCVLGVNGNYHDTPTIRKKDAWKSKLMLGQYVEDTNLIIEKVVNFDAEYLKLKKNRPLAIAELKKALASPDRIYWADA